MGEEHASEAEAFASVAVGDCSDFRALSYLWVYRALEASATESDREYLAYLGERYFAKSDKPADRADGALRRGSSVTR